MEDQEMLDRENCIVFNENKAKNTRAKKQDRNKPKNKRHPSSSNAGSNTGTPWIHKLLNFSMFKMIIAFHLPHHKEKYN